MQRTPEITKREVAKYIFDSNIVELISYLGEQEIEVISRMLTIGNSDNEERKKYPEIEENPIIAHVYNFMMIRCSIKGFRSEQAVKIFNSKTQQKPGEKVVYTDEGDQQ